MSTQKTAEILVKAITSEKNLKAQKALEKILKDKCEKRIKQVLDDK